MGYRETAKLPKWHAYLPANVKKRGSAAWSGQGAPPAIGAQVTVAINAIGPALVTGYFVEYGFLGLLVVPTRPPAWYVKQNGRGAPCHVFGAELEEGQA